VARASVPMPEAAPASVNVRPWVVSVPWLARAAPEVAP
jgi:hypothetical protein